MIGFHTFSAAGICDFDRGQEYTKWLLSSKALRSSKHQRIVPWSNPERNTHVPAFLGSSHVRHNTSSSKALSSNDQHLLHEGMTESSHKLCRNLKSWIASYRQVSNVCQRGGGLTPGTITSPTQASYGRTLLDQLTSCHLRALR